MKDSYDGQKFWKGKNGKYKNYTMERIQDNLTDTSIYKVKKSLRNKYKEGD
jgi:hypothetical protein